MHTAYCRRGTSYRRVACGHKVGGIPARIVSGVAFPCFSSLIPSRRALAAALDPGDEPAEGQRGLGRVAVPLGEHGCPEGQDGGAVDADRGRCGGH